MDHSSELLAVAGLLHDIGEFAQRAGWSTDRMWTDEATRSAGYRHAMLSAAFVEQYVPSQWRNMVAGIVERHHRPQQPADFIIQRADHFSASSQDVGATDDETAQPKQLRSVFSVLTTEGGESVPLRYLRLRPLALQDDIPFAGEALTAAQSMQDYARLWQEFMAAAESLRDVHESGGDLATYLESLRYMLQRYTWCVPSASAASSPDVSLYTHAHTTAALAAVLQAAETAAQSKVDDTASPVALLVGGDLSGIQEFLYTINARRAASSLRGRSFYLQMVTEAAVRMIVRSLGLPELCILYVGGGNFTLLARPSDEEAIARTAAQITSILLDHHHGQLSLSCVHVPLTEADFRLGAISARWEELSRKQAATKLRRLSALPHERLVILFEPSGSGGEKESTCGVCGREQPGLRADVNQETEEESMKCGLCRSFEELGRSLRAARYLRISEAAPAGPLSQGYAGVLAALGLEVEPLDKQPADSAFDRARRHHLLALDDDAQKSLPLLSHVVVGRRFLVNTTPRVENSQEREALDAYGAALPEGERLPNVGDIKPFDILEQQATGIKRLGVLRMDIDNLGETFRSGFGRPGTSDSVASLSRIAGLSFAIGLFFEGWLGVLAERLSMEIPWQRGGQAPPVLTGRLYSIYSGGDDLFFVGSWDAVVELAVRVRRDLDRYSGGHPRIHASAGIELIGGKAPLYQAADAAGEAEASAKAVPGKDAVNFLGETLPWSRFALDGEEGDDLATVHSAAHWLKSLVEDEQERALLRRLLAPYESYLHARKQLRAEQGVEGPSGQPQTPWGPWTWQMLYSLSRAGDRAGAGATASRQLAERLHADDSHLMERLGVAARWADYLTRG